MYKYYRKITVDCTKVSGTSNHTNFVFLFKSTENWLKTTGNGGDITSSYGYDLVFKDAVDGNILNHEILEYNGTSGSMICWVKIPTLKYAEDTDIYIYYSDSTVTTSQENISGTWSNNFELIHHMNNASGTITDSLGSHNSNSETGMTYQQTGKINKSILFDEVDDHYTISGFDYGDTFTISMWAKVTDNTGNFLQYFFSHDVVTTNPNLNIYFAEDGNANPDDTIAYVSDDISSYETMVSDVSAGDKNATDGQWHLIHVIRVRNGTSRLLIDGQEQATFSSPNTAINPEGSIYIGGRQDLNSDRFFGGYLEELHIISAERTADWCATEYANQNSPISFYTIGTQRSKDYYSCYRYIDIDNTKVFGSSNHVDFSMLFFTTADWLKTVENGGRVRSDDGYDIIFMDETGITTLSHEIISYNGSTGEFIAYVKIPILKYNEDTKIRIYYGNGSISSSQEDIVNTWSSYHKGVWHLKESGSGVSDEFLDSSGNENHGTGGNGSPSNTPTRTSGNIGYCQSFDGNDYISMGDVLEYGKATAHSYSAWIKTSSGSAMQIIGKASHSTWQGVWCDLESTGDLSFFMYDSGGNVISKTGNTNFTDNAWHYITVTYSGNGLYTGINLYADGSLIAHSYYNDDTLTGAIANNFPFEIGAANDSGYFWNGLIGECRFKNYVIPLEWHQTEYANLNSPSTFYSIDKEICLNNSMFFGCNF